MITDPAPARPYRSAGNTADPDSLPIDPKEVTQKPLDRERVIDAQPDDGHLQSVTLPSARAATLRSIPHRDQWIATPST
jgi:hypothetical protein